MSQIKINCTDQTLTLNSSPTIASGGSHEDTVEFTFCSQWNEYLKTAVFWKTKDDTYYVDLDENNECTIPEEVLQYKGTMYFGVFGVNGNVTRTSEVIKYRIVEGVMTSDDSNPDDVPAPDPSVYARILASYNEVHTACNTLSNTKADKVTSATNGHVAILDATGNLADGGVSIANIEMDYTRLQADTGVADADLVVFHDTSASMLKKITFSGFVNVIKFAIGNFFAKTTTYTAEIPAAGWSANAPYVQTVAVTGILATDNPIPGIVYAGTDNVANIMKKDAWACVDRIITVDGSITLTCFEVLPENDFTLALKVVR